MQAAFVPVLQARLHLPLASQRAAELNPAAAAAYESNVGARCSSSLGTASALAPSQFFNGGAKVVVWSRDSDSEPCSSSGYSRSPLPLRRVGQVVCMAKERRVKMVSQQIKREISEMLLYDKVVQAAVLPETALGADMYLTAVATISEVEMSKDLSVAKVYISIYGDDRGQEKALEALKNKAGYVRKGLAKRMNLKNTPEVRFIKDESLERGSRVIGVLDKLKKERQLKEGNGPSDEADVDGEQQDDPEYDVEDTEEEKSIRSFSQSKDDGDESDWDEAENITFIK